MHEALRARAGRRGAACAPRRCDSLCESQKQNLVTSVQEPAAKPGESAHLCARRVVPGHWLGPSTLCHTLEALCRQRRPAGLRVRVVATAGGGAPVLATSECGPRSRTLEGAGAPRPPRRAFSRPCRIRSAPSPLCSRACPQGPGSRSASASCGTPDARCSTRSCIAGASHVVAEGATNRAPPPWVPASTRLVHWSPTPQRACTRRVEAEFEAAPAGDASSAPPPAAAGAPAGPGGPACADADAADAAGRGAPGGAPAAGAPAAGAAAAGAPGLLLLVPLMLGLHGKVRRRGARRRTCMQALRFERPCGEEQKRAESHRRLPRVRCCCSCQLLSTEQHQSGGAPCCTLSLPVVVELG